MTTTVWNNCEGRAMAEEDRLDGRPVKAVQRLAGVAA
jgi:hypothetical protein